MSVAGKSERAAGQGESQYVKYLDPSKQGCMQPQLRYAIRVRLRLRCDAVQYSISIPSNVSLVAREYKKEVARHKKTWMGLSMMGSQDLVKLRNNKTRICGGGR